MVRDDLYITIPTFFRCPISLDVMKSPVSLCTGVTYDRSSIQTWLDNGNNTCPATMQVLHTKDFVPNHTLHRLIRTWSDSNRTRSDSILSDPDPVPSLKEVHVLIGDIKERKDGWFMCLVKIGRFCNESDENRKFLVRFDGFVEVLVGVLRGCVDVVVCEEVVRVLVMIVAEFQNKEEFLLLECLDSILLVLQRGSLDARIGSVKVLESLAMNVESKLKIAAKEDLLCQLFQFASSASDPVAIEAGLSCLIALSMSKRIKLRIIRLGVIKFISKLLSDSSTNVAITEKSLKILESLSSCTEGRSEICQNTKCVPAIVQKLLKVSNSATESSATILWSCCYLFRDEKAKEMVINCNGLTKILLLIQSNCSPAVRQMAGDLLKIFRVNSVSCLSSYDTKTTHIMPF